MKSKILLLLLVAVPFMALSGIYISTRGFSAAAIMPLTAIAFVLFKKLIFTEAAKAIKKEHKASSENSNTA